MVEKETLRRIVFQQKGQIVPRRGMVEREMLSRALSMFSDNKVLVISGMRRSGKSTLLSQMMAKMGGFCYAGFEDERLAGFCAQDFELLDDVLMEAYGEAGTYFFDEVQNVDGFELFVRRLQDSGKRVLITGSNASLLSKELGSRLTGRYRLLELYPFSFSEYLKLRGVPGGQSRHLPHTRARLSSLLRRYLEEGGLPEYLAGGDLDDVRTLFDNILYRDIIARYSIRSQRQLKELVNLLMASVASRFTYNSAKKALGVSNSITVKEYVGHLSNAYLFFELPQFSFSVKEQLGSPRKIYVCDPAFYQVMGPAFSQNTGRLLENAVYIELRRHYRGLFYHSGKGECDFLVCEGMKVRQAIQASSSLAGENRKREIDGLAEAMGRFGLKEGTIVTLDEEAEIEAGGGKIHVLPAWRWMALQRGEGENKPRKISKKN